jgi:glycerol kinase
VASKNKLLTTIAYQLGGKRTYALEGSIFVAGSAVQWLRDGLGIIKHAAETGPLADKSDSMQSVDFVPAFVGLGAPYWNPNVRGALFGLTRNTGPAELAHAALESVCYQTYDLREAMRADWPGEKAANVLRVDGGMTASDWTMQRLADLLDAPVDRPSIQETTALGAAYLAGLHTGVYPEPKKFADNWRLEHRFKPAMSAATRERKLKGWARAVKGVLASDEGEELH